MNLEYQYTLQESVSFSGVGIHTGVKSNVVLHPASENYGIRFIRTDLKNRVEILANLKNVGNTYRSTTLQLGDIQIHTIEHLLSAIIGMGLDNVMIEIDAQEVPIMDASAKCFIDGIEKVGIKKQNMMREYYEVTQPIEYYDEETKSKISATPSDTYHITTILDFSQYEYGMQHAELTRMENFDKEIAPARTFCFLREIEQLVEKNLIKGANLKNALILANCNEKIPENVALQLDEKERKISQEGILNTSSLRFSNEPARHKLLDLVGDLALLGHRIKGTIIGYKPGHRVNLAFAKKIKEKCVTKPSFLFCNPFSETALMSSKEINEILPHKYPFQLVDKVLYLSKDDIVGLKAVTINEPFFQGHFPGNPVFPGVLQIESLAQTSGTLILSTVENPKDYITYFMCIDNCKFRNQVFPGDILYLYSKLLAPIRRGIGKLQTKAYVNGKIACEAVLTAMIAPKKK